MEKRYDSWDMSLNRNIKISLLFIATLGIMSGITIVSALPLISQTFTAVPHIEFLSKLMLTIPSIIIALFAPFAGMIVDRWGRLKPLYVGIFLFVLGGSSGLYLESFYLLLVGRAILGFAVALIMTSSTALLGDYFDEESRHKFMSIQGVGVALGGIVFISLGGLLAQYHWSYPFAIYLLPLLFFPFVFRSLYEPKICKHIDTEMELESSLLPVYITAFFAMVFFYMLPTQLPYLIINKLHGQPQTVGFVIATSMVFNALISKQYAKIKSRLSYFQIYSLTFLVFGMATFFIAHAKDISELFYSTIFLGTGFGLLLVNTNAWFLSKVPARKRGKASGVLTSSTTPTN
jgi:MFS family permease